MIKLNHSLLAIAFSLLLANNAYSETDVAQSTQATNQSTETPQAPAVNPILTNPQQVQVEQQPIVKPNKWVNGGLFSYHFNRTPGYQEKNIGWGIQIDISSSLSNNDEEENEYSELTEYSIVAGSYNNSIYKQTNYVGLVWYPFNVQDELNYRYGFLIATMDGYTAINNGGNFLAMLPVASIEGEKYGANIIYIPTLNGIIDGCLALQLKIKL